MADRELERIQRLVDRITKAGADQADAFYNWGREIDITAREGAVEKLKQAVSAGVGLRVFRGGRLGFGYTSDVTDDGLAKLGERVLAIAAETAVDPANGLPDPALIEPVKRRPEMFDAAVEALTGEVLAKQAIEMEKAALAEDARVKKVDEVGAGSYVVRVALATSEGFADRWEMTFAFLYASVVGEAGEEKQSAWYVDYATHLNELRPGDFVAREAARRAARMLGAKKIDSGEMPVIFEPDMTKSFLGGLLGAINGDMVFKKSSFLMDKLGQPIAPAFFTLVDDGTLDRRTGSMPFDGEGLVTGRRELVAGGVLKEFLYDTYTANKAGAKPSHTAARGYESLPSIGTTNLYLEAGPHAPEALWREVDRGVLITGMMGRGANPVNGEYSRGAQGIFIEKGELTHPVQEITVAGNMLTMLTDIDAIGSDLDWRGSTGAPSIRFSKLTIAGK